jgi:hypothetical protein
MTTDNSIVVHRLQLPSEIFDLRGLCLLIAVPVDMDMDLLSSRESHICIQTRGIV